MNFYTSTWTHLCKIVEKNDSKYIVQMKKEIKREGERKLRNEMKVELKKRK